MLSGHMSPSFEKGMLVESQALGFGLCFQGRSLGVKQHAGERFGAQVPLTGCEWQRPPFGEPTSLSVPPVSPAVIRYPLPVSCSVKPYTRNWPKTPEIGA